MMPGLAPGKCPCYGSHLLPQAKETWQGREELSEFRTCQPGFQTLSLAGLP
jgi:hypothetical protein